MPIRAIVSLWWSWKSTTDDPILWVILYTWRWNEKKKKFLYYCLVWWLFLFFSLSYVFHFMYLHSCFHFQIVHQDSDQWRTFSNRVVWCWKRGGVVLGEILLIIGVAEGWLVRWWCCKIMYLVKSRNDRMKEQPTIYNRSWRMVYSDGYGNTICLRWPGLLCMYHTPSYSSYSLPLTHSMEQHYLFSHVQQKHYLIILEISPTPI